MRTKLITAVIVGQLLVLVGEYLNSVYPLWFGKEVVLEVEPVDPRSLFRGNYVELDYRIGDLDRKLLSPKTRTLERDDIVYVGLTPQGEIYRASSVSSKPPPRGLFIRGRVDEPYSSDLDIRYGIEAYFADKDRAQGLERGLRTQRVGRARVMIAPNGKAALKDVELITPEP